MIHACAAGTCLQSPRKILQVQPGWFLRCDDLSRRNTVQESKIPDTTDQKLRSFLSPVHKKPPDTPSTGTRGGSCRYRPFYSGIQSSDVKSRNETEQIRNENYLLSPEKITRLPYSAQLFFLTSRYIYKDPTHQATTCLQTQPRSLEIVTVHRPRLERV